jgi:hypothetical protein
LNAAFGPPLLAPALQRLRRRKVGCLQLQACFKADEADSNAFTLIQRFGSAANINTDMH